MIEVEATQEILVGLAGTRVLCGNHAWNSLHKLADTKYGRHRNIVVTDDSLRSTFRDAHQLLSTRIDDEFLEDIRLPFVAVGRAD